MEGSAGVAGRCSLACARAPLQGKRIEDADFLSPRAPAPRHDRRSPHWASTVTKWRSAIRTRIVSDGFPGSSAGFIVVPGLGVDPEGYFSFVAGLLASRRFDVLLPIHEQGFLFAAATPAASTACRCRASQLSELRAGSQQDRVQPTPVRARLAATRRPTSLQVREPWARWTAIPFVLKASIGTASRGIWMVHARLELQQAIKELAASGSSREPLLVQELVHGFVEHAQAVFSSGSLIGFHAYRQLSRGAGGGDARKESIRRPAVRAHLVQLGERLRWHGALSVDYILDRDRGIPLYIDCNPRLVEPMSAFIAGLDLTELLIRISCGDAPPIAAEGREGVRTHIAMQALLGCAIREPSRWKLLGECWRLIFRREPYGTSREELTPARWDWVSVVPAIFTALWLLVHPKAAHYLPRRGWGSHLLNPQSVDRIRNMRPRHGPNAPA